jgi:hypothetical protein
MSSHGLYLCLGAMPIAVGAYAMICADRIAKRNRDHIDSGKELYFEERRSWEAYGTRPKTDPKLVRRGGLILIGLGLVPFVEAAFVHYYNS